jgi:hypothetical protein
MTVDDWVLEAVERLGRGKGSSVREIQRFIDEHHHEELALDTIGTSLARWLKAGRLEQHDGSWRAVKATGKEDAMRRLFND